MKNKISKFLLEENSSIIDALTKMDEIDSKLLIITTNGKYKTLLSIGDIQRVIIKGFDIKTKINVAYRENVKVCYSNESNDEIKQKMLSLRCEFMPILDDANELFDVVFWNELFENNERNNSYLDLPVIIMAGGEGSRLKPITNIIPKPLVPIGEKAIIEIIVDRFNKLGCKEFYCSVNYKYKMIENYFDEIIDKDYKIEFFKEDFPMGTAGSLSLVKDKIKTTFFVNNCDIIIDQDYSEIYEFHKKHNYQLTIVAAIKNYKIPYGTLEVSENGKLESIQEKPDYNYFVNTGMYILEPNLLDLIPNDRMFHITELFEEIKKRNGNIGVFPVSEGSWFDIGNWEEYNKTQEIFKRKYQ
jgi:dTDP-glucose pyrophosphorylase